VFKRKDITKNIREDIIFDVARSATPISSGKGEAMIKPAITGRKYFFTREGDF